MKRPMNILKNTSSKNASSKAIAKKHQGNVNKFGELLFEIGCEEIPAGMIEKACSDLHQILLKKLNEQGLVAETSSEKSLEVFGAARRLVAVAREVRLRQEDVTKEIIGPPKSVAFNNVGEPTRAATAFAEKQGIAISELLVV